MAIGQTGHPIRMLFDGGGCRLVLKAGPVPPSVFTSQREGESPHPNQLAESHCRHVTSHFRVLVAIQAEWKSASLQTVILVCQERSCRIQHQARGTDRWQPASSPYRINNHRPKTGEFTSALPRNASPHPFHVLTWRHRFVCYLRATSSSK